MLILLLSDVAGPLGPCRSNDWSAVRMRLLNAAEGAFSAPAQGGGSVDRAPSERPAGYPRGEARLRAGERWIERGRGRDPRLHRNGSNRAGRIAGALPPGGRGGCPAPDLRLRSGYASLRA